MLRHVNNFENDVLKNNKLILVDFYAEWCGPCKMITPILEKISKEDSSFDIVKVNIDQNLDLAMQYSVMSIPTMLLFKDGTMVDNIIGFSNEQGIKDLVNKYIN